ncbi:MAG: hypothetical protein U5K33_03940 [Halofilum sp. (in: g-proteobacteria)]|nr:hypothetical protein [Halofilum sp. (in: g-proteobacteria)]
MRALAQRFEGVIMLSMRKFSHSAIAPLVIAVLLTACVPATAEHADGKADLPPGVSNAFAGMLGLSPADFRAVAAERGFVTTDDGVVLDLQTEGLRPAHREAFDQPGLRVRSFHPQYERASVVATSPRRLVSVAELPFVRRVAPSYGATGDGASTGGY